MAQTPITLEQLAADATEIGQRVDALAQVLHYEGDLSVSALVDGVRLYMRRTVDDCLQMGARLALLREQTDHGRWLQVLAQIGMSQSTAKRFVTAAVKTAKSPKLGDLVRHAKTQGHMLELLVLEDEQAQLLLDGGAIGDIQLDDIETAPASELRKRLRAALDDSKAKDQVLADKSAKIDRLDTALAKAKAASDQRALLVQVETMDPDVIRDQLIDELSRRSLRAESEIRTQVRPALLALREHLADGARPGEAEQLIAGMIGQLQATIEELRLELGVRVPDGRAVGAELTDILAAPDPTPEERRASASARLDGLRDAGWTDEQIRTAWPGLLEVAEPSDVPLN
jgi:hypothetical protein